MKTLSQMDEAIATYMEASLANVDRCIASLSLIDPPSIQKWRHEQMLGVMRLRRSQLVRDYESFKAKAARKT